VDNYGDLVDYWITFNEPHVFAMLTYCAGAWPGGDPDMLETATAAMPKGVFKVVMKAMADAHLDAYDIIHKNRCLFFPTSFVSLGSIIVTMVFSIHAVYCYS
jgi:beta-glucosidase/6-phospho-beta-glucosidase/beta-galactosidase